MSTELRAQVPSLKIMKRMIILASASKARSLILTSCGLRHKVVVSGAYEISGKGLALSALVIKNARAKAEKVASRYERAVIISADTLVRMGKSIIGKPKTEKEAKRLLGKFSGKRVEVFTGLFLIDTASGKNVCGYEKSLVCVESLTAHEIETIFRLLGPYDKAGGFSIEGVGSMVFDNIRGSYFNIIGLPMVLLRKLFKKLGLEITDFIK